MTKSFLFYDLILLSGLCLLLGGIGGTPFYHPDFITGNMFVAIQSGGNPHFFNYPGLVIYLNAFVYGVIFLGMYLCGLVHHPQDFGQLVRSGYLIEKPVAISFFAPGHLITLAWSIGGVLCTYLLTYRLVHHRWVALMSGILVCTALLWVSDSHFVTVDIPLATLTLATVLLTVVFSQQRQPLLPKHLIFLGMALGLATSAKYNGALVITSIISALPGYQKTYRQYVKACVIIVSVGVTTFLLTNPFILIDFKAFLSDFLLELNHAKVGHHGYTSEHAWWFHLTFTLSYAYGVFPLLLCLIGLGWILKTNRLRLSDKLAITVFPMIYYWFMGNSRLTFDRYMLPVLPFIAIYSSLGIYGLYCAGQSVAVSWSKRFKKGIFLIFVVAFVPNLLHAIRHDLLLTRQDTRKWLQVIIKESQLDHPDRTILAGAFLRYLFLSAKATITEFETEVPKDIDIIIFDSFSHDSFIYDPRFQMKLPPMELYTNQQVVQISPFILPKELVPFAPKSVYSPYLPDLRFRQQPGPFIEIFCKNDTIAHKVLEVCHAHGFRCASKPGKEGYYLKKLKLLMTSEAKNLRALYRDEH